MLKGLKGILEKAVQVAAPIIGNIVLPGGIGAAAGSGIAGLLTGQKPKDAIISAGLSGLLASRLPGGTPPSSITRGETVRRGNEMYDNITRRLPKKSFFSKIGDALVSDKGPTALGTSLAVGLPAVLAGIAAAQDAKKAQPMDPAMYQSATDRMYGGQFASPPANRRISNLEEQITLPQTVFQTSPISRAEGGVMNVRPPSYSAVDGSTGIMGLAEGGDVDIKELETLMEDGKMTLEEAMDYLKSIADDKAKGGFPRKTGMINGPGGPKDDKIPAMLSNGEFVFTAKAVKEAGGPGVMYSMMNKLDPESEKPTDG
tara:strand:+ start:316 stop:1260 length:945 start_codon:yes stop_codon:yes gene_type:complete